MARLLRIELSGGLYHVTSRGDRREDIYFSDEDRKKWLELLGQVCSRFNCDQTRGQVLQSNNLRCRFRPWQDHYA